jgi:hypothetical protein
VEAMMRTAYEPGTIVLIPSFMNSILEIVEEDGDLHQVKWWNGANDDRMYHSIYSDEEVKYWRHMFLQSDVLVLWKPS